jgi:RNA polymerase sigma factor (sigma-70 family)
MQGNEVGGPEAMTEAGLEAVFMRSRPALLRFLKARGAGEDGEDLLQELWMKASSAQTGPIAEPLSYLYRVANNLMLDRRRSEIRSARRDQDWSDSAMGTVPGVSDEPSGERVLIARERLRRVQIALAALGERTETIFRRYRLDGVSQRDIAGELGISVSAVEKHLQKAYRALSDIGRTFDAE